MSSLCYTCHPGVHPLESPKQRLPFPEWPSSRPLRPSSSRLSGCLNLPPFAPPLGDAKFVTLLQLLADVLPHPSQHPHAVPSRESPRNASETQGTHHRCSPLAQRRWRAPPTALCGCAAWRWRAARARSSLRKGFRMTCIASSSSSSLTGPRDGDFSP